MTKLLEKIINDHPKINFEPKDSFSWWPKKQTVNYVLEKLSDDAGSWSLLHEVGHGKLGHQKHGTDFNLLKLEIDAWKEAKVLAKKYGVSIDQEHIENCLDSYRDWLYLRSTCPTCTSTSQQISTSTYRCFNCNTEWKVSSPRQCRPYRMLNKKEPR